MRQVEIEEMNEQKVLSFDLRKKHLLCDFCVMFIGLNEFATFVGTYVKLELEQCCIILCVNSALELY